MNGGLPHKQPQRAIATGRLIDDEDIGVALYEVCCPQCKLPQWMTVGKADCIYCSFNMLLTFIHPVIPPEAPEPE